MCIFVTHQNRSKPSDSVRPIFEKTHSQKLLFPNCEYEFLSQPSGRKKMPRSKVNGPNRTSLCSVGAAILSESIFLTLKRIGKKEARHCETYNWYSNRFDSSGPQPPTQTNIVSSNFMKEISRFYTDNVLLS